MSNEPGKFQALHEKQTNGINCGHTTEDVIEQLKAWDQAFGIELTDVETDSVEFALKTLPDDLDSFVRQVYEFCPDTVDQGFGCYAEIYGNVDPKDLPAYVTELADGIDFDDEEYGLEIMKRSIRRDRKVGLWWD